MEISPKHILLVDDDHDIRAALGEVLEMEGFTVGEAGNGREAIDYLIQKIPNAILLDVMMPVMNGFEFREAQMASPLWAGIPVIVMSADGKNQDRHDLLRGASFVKKPPDLAELLRSVHAITASS
jgi:CheY-like chemotaxis protein